MKAPIDGHAFRRIFTLATLLKLCAVSFYLGYRNAVNESAGVGGAGWPGSANDAVGCATTAAAALPSGEEISPEMRRRIDARLTEEWAKIEKADEGYTGRPFPKSTVDFAVGMLRVPREEFMDEYDFGVPFRREPREDVDALIIYNNRNALPTTVAAKRGDSGGGIAKASVKEAMENCDTLNVIFTPLNNKPKVPECLLMIGNFESYHVNRWMRMPKFTESNKKMRQLNHTLPLRHHGRITLPQGMDEFDLPPVYKNFKRREKGEITVMAHFDRLRAFLENVDDVLKDVDDLLKKRNVVRDNTVVVMTVNAGQSELLSNFVCNARARGFDIGNVLVFPTDEQSHRLAQGLGVASYLDVKNLGVLPSGEAKQYGDPIFASMMYAKVLCVLYVSLLGHDVLFQDVDIVWFKDPLQYFHDGTNDEIRDFDVMFQHDGSAQPRYNPYSANSGFYYVRANKKTQYLFTSLLYHGAVVRHSKSHQQVLVQLLNEHSSLFGLRVKVFDKHKTDVFPGGFHFHQHWDVMRDIIGGKSNAYILHMSWTENKVNKLKFFRQLGEWYLEDHCVDSSKLTDGDAADGGLIGRCCSAEPIFSCHFQDKPSKLPCPDSPKIDEKRGKPFWD